jgi:hypothetical protein
VCSLVSTRHPGSTPGSRGTWLLDEAGAHLVAASLEAVMAEADPQKAKALLRLLIGDLRVDSRAEILPTAV